MRQKILFAILLLNCATSYSQQNDSLNRYDSDNLRTGKWVGHWTETGKISSVEYYIGGKRNGLCIYYDVNGRLQNEIEYRNDSLHGVFKFYSPNGQKEVSEFKHGKQEGITRYYNYKGQLVEEYEYHNNMRNGFHRIYSESGRIIMESNYVDGRENGTRRSYKDNSKRELILETDFVNDRRVEVRHYKNEKLIKTIKYDMLPSNKTIEG